MLALLPGPAMAQPVCDTLRPGWDGAPVSAANEAIALFTSPAALVLLAATAIAAKLRNQWAALGACVGWSILVSAYTFFDLTGGARTAGMAEGCVGSPMLFIGVVFALCVAIVVYTGPPPRKD